MDASIPTAGTAANAAVRWANDRDQRLATLAEPLRPILPRVRCIALLSAFDCSERRKARILVQEVDSIKTDLSKQLELKRDGPG